MQSSVYLYIFSFFLALVLYGRYQLKAIATEQNYWLWSFTGPVLFFGLNHYVHLLTIPLTHQTTNIDIRLAIYLTANLFSFASIFFMAPYLISKSQTALQNEP